MVMLHVNKKKRTANQDPNKSKRQKRTRSEANDNHCEVEDVSDFASEGGKRVVCRCLVKPMTGIPYGLTNQSMVEVDNRPTSQPVVGVPQGQEEAIEQDGMKNETKVVMDHHKE